MTASTKTTPPGHGPFSQARQEHDGSRSYFLPASFARVEVDKPVYVIGTRGAGKTTFLKALCWSERLTNKSLQRQLRERDGDLFHGRYIGVYMKLPKSQMYVFDRWISDSDEDRPLYSDLVGLYLALQWAELMVQAVAELIDQEVLEISPDQEAGVVRELCDEHSAPAFKRQLDSGRVRTFRGVAKAIREIRRAYQAQAQARRPVEHVVQEFPVERLTGYAQFVAETLVGMLPKSDERPWSFRVCIDEAESMSLRQVVVMNSIIRTAEWPLLPVVAWVSLSAWGNQTDGPLTVGRADVADVPLDRMSDSEFRAFVEGVSSVRVHDAVGKAAPDVSLDTMLGSLDINGLLKQIISKSSSARGRTLLSRAEDNVGLPFFQDAIHDSPPIYQTYLVDRLSLEVPAPSTPTWRKRGQHSAEIRKKIVASYLAICQELNTDPWYASADMVIQMSDGCVRDFLWQMDEIWSTQSATIERFIAGRVPDARQDRALKAASQQKMARIGGLVISEPKQAERLVDGLARLTAALQRPTNKLGTTNGAHLRSPEPGYWVLPSITVLPSALPDRDRENLPWTYRLVVDAAEAGYLRMEPKEHAPWRFRVHTSLAAAYGFSYRGAQYEVPVHQADLAALCEATGAPAREKVVTDLYRRLRSSGEPLFTV